MRGREIVCCLGLSLLAACSGGAHRAPGVGTDVGMRPVSFTLARVGGGKDALDAHRGHVVLLDLWASWCPPCREELPELSQLAQSNPQLVVLAANQGETGDVALGVMKRLRLHLPVLLDREQAYGAAYATVGLPTAVVLGADGKIAAIETGARSAEQWRRLLAKVASH